MKQRETAKVFINSDGELFVCPKTEDPDNDEFIYREGNGLRWDKKERGFCAYEPSRWQHEELVRHIASTLRSSQNENLLFTDETTWVGVSPELREELIASLGQAAPNERGA